MNDVEVSIIVPFANAARHLGDLLESLATQDVRSTWEVVAVDNGSADGSREIVDAYVMRIPIRVVDAPARRGAAHARNAGVEHARGWKLLFIDADDALAPGYVAAMAAALEVHDFVTSAFDHEALNPEWVRQAHGPVWRDPTDPLPVLFGVLPFAGGSVGITRAAFEAAGGYPEDFQRAQDIAFSWDVQLAGYRLHYVPEAVYHVRYRATIPALFRQSLDWGTALPLLHRRYRNLGMQRRPLRHAVRMWLDLLPQLVRARRKADVAPVAVRAGLLLGRARGSMRHRTYFP